MNNELKTKNFFIQVNIGDEAQKAGSPINETLDLYEYATSENLDIKGLMCIPPLAKEPDIYFKKMRDLRESLTPEMIWTFL